MKFELFDFQEAALEQLRIRVKQARELASPDYPQAISFSAPTGSGKTVMMAALFEDILFGALGLEAQPDASILWLSDMPELNEQTHRRINQVSDRIGEQRLLTIDADFDRERLEPGVIHFINIQKLGNDKRLTRQGDGRAYPIWSTFTNTARLAPERFYLVIDEAHRGMTSARNLKEARTLVQRFLLGHPASGLIPMPLVIGISATPKRFVDLLEQAPHTQHKVTVPVAEVRASGLLKDRVPIHHPDAAGEAEMTLLEEAARTWQQMRHAWDAYCTAENEPQRVWPVLVVQIENGTDTQTSRTDLAAAIAAIERATGVRLREGEAVHALHDCGDLAIGDHNIRRVDASRIDENKDIGVVFFKTSLSTGWDCPRAEVMMSFRRAEDHTYIAQLLGRMVRTPLARRIERDAALNDVHLFLPHFDAEAVKAVIADLNNVEETPPAETGSSRELVILTRRPGTEAIFAANAALMTYRVNAVRAQSPIRRYVDLARRLNIDDIEPSAWKQAKQQMIAWMEQEIDQLKADGRYAKAEAAITRVKVTTITAEADPDNPEMLGSGLTTPVRDYELDASEADIERQFAEAGRTFSNALHQAYWQAHAERDALEVKVEAIVLSRQPQCIADLEAKAESAFNALYDQHKQAIGKLPERERQRYNKLRRATAKPKPEPWCLDESIPFRRSDKAPAYDKHLYLEEDGQFRADLGTWEHDLLELELTKPEVVAWLRNLDRKSWSLEIPYQTGGEIRPMFPDLVIVRQQTAADGTVSGYLFDILEPHDPSRGDNFEKAIGLARFAEEHGHLFGRIELLRKDSSGHFHRLELNDTSIINKILLVTSNPQLDAVFETCCVIGN
ncbi:Type III restriction enzyme, res subunit [Thiorhodovibrio winogradskyi]|uniref:Type III restriction enzyme, res subunit n=1 Tax=Thiorhodovibrio winogradskyi TaxID=77007 RepID=A0ABZ0SD58_9GAMM|nr:DEAD/DEAH box helicase family protein [Thiorhodovibrio winogradskyi]